MQEHPGFQTCGLDEYLRFRSLTPPGYLLISEIVFGIAMFQHKSPSVFNTNSKNIVYITKYGTARRSRLMRKRVLIAAALLVACIGGLGNPTKAFAYSVSGANTVTVESGDTLSKIAKAHDTTYKRLFDANTQIADPNLIFVGQTIRIPTADEQLADRQLPGSVAPSQPQPVAPVTPKPAAKAAAAPAVASNSVWDRLADCESSGNWAINTGNGFYGGLQFTLSSWQAVGGSGYPNQASREEQIARAEKLLAMQGWGAWPACSAKLGLR